MVMLKRFGALVLCVVMVAGVLLGCSNNTPSSSQSSPQSSPQSSEPSAEKQVTLEFWFPDDSKMAEELNKKAIEDFEKANPNIKVNMTILSTNAGDHETKLNAAVLSDTFPDVYLAYLGLIGTRGALGDFAVLDDYIDKWSDKDDILPAALETGKFKGQTIGLGAFPAPMIYAYRKDFFEEAGLDPNKPPKTWAELEEYALKLVKRDGQTVVRSGFDIPAVDSALVFTEPFMRSAGSPVIDEINQKPSWLDDNAVAALDFIGQLAQKNVAIPHDFQKPSERPIIAGKGAIGVMPGEFIPDLKKNNPELFSKFGFMEPITRDGSKPGIGFCGYRLYTIGETSKNKDEAWKFIEFLMSAENMWARAEQLNIAPVRKSLQEKFISLDPIVNKFVIQYVDQGKGKAVTPWTNISNKYGAIAFEEVIGGKKTAKQALQDMYDAVMKEIE